MCPNPPLTNLAQRGFSLVTAIFILVILAILGAFMVSFSATQQSTIAMDIQSARALQAARAGVEWGAFQLLKVPPPGATCADYPGSTIYNMTFNAPALTGFSTSVNCFKTSHTEGANTIVVYVLTSTAIYGAVNTPDYVNRQITARLATCTEPGPAATPC